MHLIKCIRHKSDLIVKAPKRLVQNLPLERKERQVISIQVDVIFGSQWMKRKWMTLALENFRMLQVGRNKNDSLSTEKLLKCSSETLISEQI